MTTRLFVACLLPVLVWTGCRRKDSTEAARRAITPELLAEHIQVLASDEFLGRAPASPGEEKTVNYLIEQFQALGLRPGNGDSYTQEVPLAEITADPASARLEVQGRRGRLRFRYGDEAMFWTKRLVPEVSVTGSEVVFVGYGIVAPEYDWNDYAGVDVRGKTVVILVNDPGYATGDSTLFTGRAMTYYGRWTYKFEEAARQGAAAALIIHETGPAGYPWAVVQGSWSGPQFTLVNEQQNMDRCAIEGWLTYESARRLFELAGRDLEQLKAAAARPGFRAVPLGLRLSATLRNTTREVRSRNVLALLPGRERPDEVVIYTAHWDHLGVDPSLPGDSIYNGALDNATGTAGLLALARAFTALPEPPARSVLFLAVTAEEQGLLGSAYYATHPVFPPEKTVAVLNMDGLNVLGPMRDVTVIGYGMSELDDYAAAAAEAQGRYLRPDPEPEKGYYYRSDHFSFARVGIPALYLDAGIDHVEHGPDWTLARRAEYVERHYHKPSDEYDPAWDLRGAVDDLRLLFDIGYRLANSTDFPNWREGTPFRALREQQRAGS
ncbi:M28 family metallopeptidase [Rhodothermus marinus]|uniref:M28 family metallopeptidase n=1 Tax=Rhodothermus marinus TaxID=29549 RepID=UPI0012BA3A65|nr:M28 family metallopeptidase [Rhodothermus marinus]BBM70854.1 hypothetical protein RmaAA213_27000 [Rhodothermus marinus]BBM73833.1 hypothetical protein RmaAA338_26980 [Rhodothermus marinus]